MDLEWDQPPNLNCHQNKIFKLTCKQNWCHYLTVTTPPVSMEMKLKLIVEWFYMDLEWDQPPNLNCHQNKIFKLTCKQNWCHYLTGNSLVQKLNCSQQRMTINRESWIRNPRQHWSTINKCDWKGLSLKTLRKGNTLMVRKDYILNMPFTINARTPRSSCDCTIKALVLYIYIFISPGPSGIFKLHKTPRCYVSVTLRTFLMVKYHAFFIWSCSADPTAHLT